MATVTRPVPLAETTRKARRRGVCGLCGRVTLPGQRIARIREHGYTRWVHAACCVELQRAARPGPAA